MLTVGIHENLIFTKAQKNEKGSLVVSIKQANDVNPLDILNGTGVNSTFDQPEQDFLFYPPSVTDFQGNMDTVDNILDKINEVKNPLNLILLQFTTSGNIKWDIFAGTGLTTADDLAMIVTNPSKLEKIYANIADQFIRQITPYLNETGKKFRMIFPRRNKLKHFPVIRSRFLETQPFIEPMTIPKEASKLKWSPFEIKNGLNQGDPVGGEQKVSQKEADAANALLS